MRIALADLRVEHHAGVIAQAQRQVEPRQGLAERTAGDHAASLQQHHVVGQARHLVERVADVDDGQRQRLVQAVEIRQDRRLGGRIERGQRLVHEQEARAHRECACDRNALALAAGQRVDAPLQQGRDAQQLDRLLQRNAALGRRNTTAAIVQVAAHIEVREQARFLEHDADGAAVRRHEHALVLPHLAAQREAALGRTLQAGDAAQQRGLARAGGAEQCGDAARRCVERRIERESGVAQLERCLDHVRTSARRRLSAYTPSSITNEATSSSSASRCAAA